MTNSLRRDVALVFGELAPRRFVIMSDEFGVYRFDLGTERSDQRIIDLVSSFQLPETQLYIWSKNAMFINKGEMLNAIVCKPDDKHREIFNNAKNEAEILLLEWNLVANYISRISSLEENVEQQPVIINDEPVSRIIDTTIYTDASLVKSGGKKGCYGWLVRPENSFVLQEFDVKFTSHFSINDLEAAAILSAVIAKGNGSSLVIYSDSKAGAQSALEAIDSVRNNKSIDNWFLRRNINKSDLYKALTNTKIDIRWVKGHNNNLWNSCIDFIVTSARAQSDYSDNFSDEDILKTVKRKVKRWISAANRTNRY